MRLVDEEDDGHVGALHLLDYLLEPVLELALHRCSGLQEAEIKGAQHRALQAVRHIAVCEAPRKALDHRGLAHAGLAGEDRVVLAAAHQDVNHLADLGVAADDFVNLSLTRLTGKVNGVKPERLAAAGALTGEHAGGLTGGALPGILLYEGR